jgi:hypothetical protein
MEAVNILRLKSGEDIICYMENYDDEEIVVRDPMTILLYTDNKTGKQTIALDHWLPVTLLRMNEANIKNVDVLATLTPSSVFSEYYVNAVNVINNSKMKFDDSGVASSNDAASNDALTQEDMNLILEAMDPTKVRTMH